MDRKFKKGRDLLRCMMYGILPVILLLLASVLRAQQPAGAAPPVYEFSLPQAIDFAAKMANRQ